MQSPLRFTPSRVEGLPAVLEAAVFPDRIELTTPDRVVVHRFADIARRPRPRWLWRLLDHVGVRPRGSDVADRDWFHDGPDMFFDFYTRPRIKVYMPLDEQKESYGSPGLCASRPSFDRAGLTHLTLADALRGGNKAGAVSAVGLPP